MSNLYTIGYEGLSLQQFIQIVKKHDIRIIVDVRELPLSRKPGFSKNKLSKALEIAGIRYKSIRSLGSPRSLRHEYRKSRDWDDFSKHFSIYLETQNDLLNELVVLAYQETACLLCFERNNTTCHRSIVAKRAVESAKNGLRVTHL